MEWDKDTIRAFRKKHNLTQAQLAKVMGTSRVLISNWETGKQKPCGMSQKFLTLLAFTDIKKDIEEFISSEQKEDKISSDTILALREKLSLSQTEFAEKLGRDNSTVSKWESGQKSPGKKSILLLKKLASEEGISLEELGKETESSGSKDCSGDEGCSDSKKSAPQDNRSYNIGGANFTADSKNFSDEKEIKAVASGIDILYYGFYVDVEEKVLNRLESAKEKAVQQLEEGGDGDYLFDIGDYTFNMKASGEGVYAYVLSNSDLRIKVSSSSSLPHPSVYVRLNSLFILENGVESAVEKVRNFVSSNFGKIKEEKVSKVEIYCDLVGANLTREDYDKFVSKAGHRAIYEENGKFTGFTFGKGDIIGKVYLKTEEIKVHHKDYMYEMWDDVKEGEEVWRIEFELNRKILREFGVESFDDFKQVKGDIWRYLTEEWLSMRELDNENTTLRTRTLFWEKVMGVREFFGSVTGKVREKKRESDLWKNISVIKGCTTTIGAIRFSEGNFVSLKEIRKEIDFFVDKQLAGVDLSACGKSSIEALSEIGFYQESYRKSVAWSNI